MSNDGKIGNQRRTYRSMEQGHGTRQIKTYKICPFFPTPPPPPSSSPSFFCIYSPWEEKKKILWRYCHLLSEDEEKRGRRKRGKRKNGQRKDSQDTRTHTNTHSRWLLEFKGTARKELEKKEKKWNEEKKTIFILKRTTKKTTKDKERAGT